MVTTTQLPPVETVPSLKDRVYQIIKQYILDHLSPGDPLVIDQLVAQLGVSRTPVREALLVLEQERLVESIPYKGTFVARLSKEEVKQIYQVREALECLAVKLAALAIPLEDLEQIKAQLDEAEEAIEQGNLEVHFRTDTGLHGLIGRYTGNEVLQDLIENLGDRIYRIRRYSLAKSGEHLRRSLQEHRLIVEALLARNPELAEQHMRDHIRQAGQRILALVEE